MTRWLLLCVALLSGGAAWADDNVWAALREPGAVGLMRHARAPGTGDPPGFRLGDCATQRNLSAAGRDQAVRAGQALKTRGVRAQVYSSQWCRALDTARLMDLGPVHPLPLLNSLIGNPDYRGQQTAETRRFIETWTGPPLILVTHQVNIAALTGLPVAEAEIIVLRRTSAGYQIVGRLSPVD